MKKNAFLTLILALCFSAGYAQNAQLEVVNAKDFDEMRYEGINGSPYYFKDWVYAKIYAADRSVYEDVLINYNGETENFEAKQGDQWIDLDNTWYSRVEVKKEKNETVFDDDYGDIVVFQRIILPDFKDKFYVVIHEGENFQFVKEYRSVISTKTVQDVGKTREMKRFMTKKNNYFLKEGKAKLVKLKKKSLLQTLGNSKELEVFIKKEKINFGSDKDLKKLLTYSESLG